MNIYKNIFDIEKFSFAYPDGNDESGRTYLPDALRDAELHVRQGEFVVILGRSGCGKTTLLRHLKPSVTPVGKKKGQIFFDGKDICSLDDRAAASQIGYVWQDVNAQLVTDKVWHELAFGLESLGYDNGYVRRRVAEMGSFFGLGDIFHRKVMELSGGQKQRVAIARALASNPKILLCDEATSALDPQTTASILELLKSINEQFQITIVIITHQMSVIREICNRVAIIEHGELVENGLVEDIFSHPKSKAARELILRDVPENSGKAEGAVAAQMERIQGDKKLRIVFTENSAFEPVIANMILQFGKPVNILRADTKNVGGVAKGEMILGLPDDRHLQIDMEQYLTEHGLEIEEVTGDVE